MACHQAARAAVSLGYKNVFIMPAGIQGWQKAGKEVEAKSS
jgi:rhodanese-related sulfurtransferase